MAGGVVRQVAKQLQHLNLLIVLFILMYLKYLSDYVLDL